MKCIQCDNCRKGYFHGFPEAYVCVCADTPFTVDSPNQECVLPNGVDDHYYVDDSGIYERILHKSKLYQMVISKAAFVDAYNKWIKEG